MTGLSLTAGLSSTGGLGSGAGGLWAGFTGLSNGGAVTPSALGALVYRSTGIGVLNGATIPFNAESYDSGGFHDNVVNPSRLTVPAGIVRGRLISNSEAITIGAMSLIKGGASFFGSAQRVMSTFADQNNVASAIVGVSTGEYFEVQNPIGSGDTYSADRTWFAFEPIAASVKSALAKKSGNQAVSAGVNTVMAFGAEEYDSDGFHNNVTNNSRLTIPSGVTLVRLSACIAITDGAGGQAVINLLKDGAATARGMFFNDVDYVAATKYIAGVSAPLIVSAGQYFETQLFTTNATTALNDDRTWFQIEELPSNHEYALVYKTGNQSLTSSVQNTLTWDAEEVDTSGIHDNTTNNSRMTVPVGKTRARVSFNLKTSNTAGAQEATVIKNGSTVVPGAPLQATESGGTDNLNGFGAWVDVVAGDYFELQVRPSVSGTSITAVPETWFCMEVA
jgi:hypothetical protein